MPILRTLGVLLLIGCCWAFPRKFMHPPLTELPPKDTADPLEIFIIPHTHDDVGWLTTVDDYFVGTVQFIIDTVVSSLKENPARKFTYVEMAYWSRWWNEQSDAVKQTVQQLVDNGQLDFNIGGWTMHDEACTHYDRQVNQFTHGNQFLYRTLGPNARPTVGWQVDPFGHSSESASIWADNGFDAFGADRIDYRVKDAMAANKGLEFVWRGSTSLGTNFDIWVHVLESFYCTPGQCGYDGGKTINPDPNLPTYPVDTVQQGLDFVNYARSISTHYPHNYVLIPYGCDFAHSNAHRDFKEMDILMDYVNSNNTLNAHVQYGHFKDYVKAINALNMSWSVYTDDFFPYASGANSYWTGYFVSHPLYKGHIRQGSALLRETEILNAITFATQNSSVKNPNQNSIDYMRQAMNIGTHHDGITGTSKAFVYQDYELQLQRGTDQCNSVTQQLSAKLVGPNPPVFTNDTVGVIGGLTAGSVVAVLVHNSLAWDRREFVAIPVNRTDVIVVDRTGARAISQIDPVPSFSNSRTSPYILYFLASVPSVGYATYFVQVSALLDLATPVGKVQGPEAGTLSNDFYTITWDDSNRLNGITNKLNGLTTKLTHDLWQYRSATGGPQPSGAYVFRPAEDNLLGIGSDQNSGDPTGHGTSNFVNAFSQTPILVASAAGGYYNDTFAIGIRSISNTQVSVNAYRVDEDYWGQDLGAMFVAMNPGSQPWSGASGFQSGQVDVGSSTTVCKTTTFNFPTAFKSAPYIVVTALNTQVNDDIVLSTVQSSSTTSATINNCRVQKGQSDWGQDVKLNWLAWDSSVVVPAGVQYGRFTVGASKGSLAQPKVPLSTGVASAAFISTVRAASSAYTTTTIDIEFDSVLLNVRRYDNGAWTDTGVSMDWIAFPKNEIVNPVIDTKTAVTATVITGPFVKSLQQFWRTGYAQTVRLFQDGSADPKAQADFNHLRISYDIGTIDSGAEVVTSFNTDIPTNGNFNGDANGLEIRPRKYQPGISEPVAGNFYPFVQSASINGASGSKDIQLTFVGDRARSVASLGNGNIQIMIHRRCLQDDGYGVGETLDDQSKITVEFYVTLDNAQNSALLRHRYQLLQNYPPLALVTRANSVSDYTSKYTAQWTALQAPLPANLHLLTYEIRNPTPTGVSPQGDTFTLLRVQHLFETGESTQYSVPVQINLSTLFATSVLNITTLEDTILSGTLARSKLNRLVWRTNTPNPMDNAYPTTTPALTENGLLKDFVVTINPREIKTYRVNSSPL